MITDKENVTLIGQSGAEFDSLQISSIDYVNSEIGQEVDLADSTLTVKGGNLIEGKSNFVIGQIVGNWNAPTGKLSGNSFSGTTDATNDIGEIESRCTVTGIPQ